MLQLVPVQGDRYHGYFLDNPDRLDIPRYVLSDTFLETQIRSRLYPQSMPSIDGAVVFSPFC